MPVRTVLLRAPRVRGSVPVPADTEAAALMDHVLTELRARKCQVRVTGTNEMVVEQGTPGRGSVLAFVDGGGTIRLQTTGGQRVLAYDFPTAGGLLLCAILSPVCAAAAWFGLDGDPGLTTFALVMPLLWLYGANYVTSRIRVPALFERLCREAPHRPSGPWSVHS